MNDSSAPAACAFTYPKTAEQFAHNWTIVQERIAAAARSAGREPNQIRLLPVSKTVDEARLGEAIDAGLTYLGENKVQEAKRKAEAFRDRDVHWAAIGHLQTNKAKDVAAFASEFHALDSVRVAAALDRQLQRREGSLDVFVQVNTSGEPTKFGVEPAAAADLVSQLHQFPTLRVRGLMTLALFDADPDRVRPCFQELRRLRNEIRSDYPDLLGTELSMGMSSDFETAIAEGATTVRVGEAIFGARSYPDSHYWPGTESSHSA